jgi:hypothetical protein
VRTLSRLKRIQPDPDRQLVSFNLLDFYRKGLRLSGLMTSFLDAEGCAAVLRWGPACAVDIRTIPAKEGWHGVPAGGER